MESINRIKQKLAVNFSPAKRNEKPKAKETPPPKPPALPTEKLDLNFQTSATFTQKGEMPTVSIQPETKAEGSSPNVTHIDSMSGTTTLSGASVKAGPNGTLMMDDSPYTTTSTVSDYTVNYLESGTAKEQSHAAVMASDINNALVQSGKAASGSWMATLGGVGGGLLIAHGLTKAVKGSGMVEKLEGVAETQWGAQSAMPGVATAAELGSWAGTAVKTLGVVGGTIQAGLGAKKAVDGVKSKDMEKTALGGADVLAGSSWMLASLGIAPAITFPAFVALTVGSKAYQHREGLKQLASKSAEKITSGVKKFTAQMQRIPGGMRASTA